MRFQACIQSYQMKYIYINFLPCRTSPWFVSYYPRAASRGQRRCNLPINHFEQRNCAKSSACCICILVLLYLHFSVFIFVFCAYVFLCMCFCICIFGATGQWYNLPINHHEQRQCTKSSGWERKPCLIYSLSKQSMFT